MDKRCFSLRYFLILALLVLAGPAAESEVIFVRVAP